MTCFTLSFAEKFENVRPGDCIVCFSKNDIYYISRQLESMNKECAVIYGGLPPGECCMAHGCDACICLK